MISNRLVAKFKLMYYLHISVIDSLVHVHVHACTCNDLIHRTTHTSICTCTYTCSLNTCTNTCTVIVHVIF